jgi:putative DNA primase/helicase
MTANEERRPGGGGAHVSFGSGTGASYPSDAGAAIDAFLAAMRRAGIGAPERVVADGHLHRFTGDGDKPGKRNAWYVLHLDGRRPAGAFGSWRTGASETWAAGGADSLTAAERAEIRRQIAEAKRQRDAERAEMQRATASSAWREWSTSEPASGDHPYLVTKGVRPHGLRRRGRRLLVPLADAEGRLWNVQRIAPDGTKRFAKGGRIAGLFCHVGGNPEAAAAVVVAEGWATAATLHEATGLPVLAAMNAGNLEPVARAARRLWPAVPLVVAADNDHGTAGNPGLAKAHDAALATGATVVAPPTMPAVTDFNDLGHAETRRAFSKIGVPGVPRVPGEEKAMQNNELDGSEGGTPRGSGGVPTCSTPEVGHV